MEKSLSEIDAMRIRLGISQVDLCREAGVSESTLSIAKKREREPTLRIRRKLAAALEAISKERGVVVVDVPDGDGR
jgi:transcriptional regulator with XRE-family HTH domain